ncbi:MAG TPA: hypothetical protein VLJ37_03900 [bacterium]|nr:hypothetical protein [bacterium]
MNKSIMTLLVILSVASSAGAGAESSFGLTDTVKKKNGVTYLCSGIGESKDDPRTSEFPMKIVFATVSSALYSDVNVKVYEEGSGKSVFDVFCDGAWLLVKLPAGKYRVSATDQKNQSRSCSMTIGSSQTQCVLRWPD